MKLLNFELIVAFQGTLSYFAVVFLHSCKRNGTSDRSVDVGGVRSWWETDLSERSIARSPQTSADIRHVCSPQACATRTTSVCCPSPSTTDRSASWSRITPVCTIIPVFINVAEFPAVAKCQTKAVTLQILSPTHLMMRADTESELRPTSDCSTWRSSWRLSVRCFLKSSGKSKKSCSFRGPSGDIWPVFKIKCNNTDRAQLGRYL